MRRTDREISDDHGILKILGKCRVLCLGMCLDGIPYVVPLNFGFEYNSGKYTFYIHCAGEGKKLDIIAKNPRVFIEADCSHELTEAETACGYGYNYESVMAEGTAEIVTDTAEKKKALALLMKHQTGKDFDFTDQQADGVTVVKITAAQVTAKSRTE